MESVGVDDLVPSKTLSKMPVKRPIPPVCDTFPCCSINTEQKPGVRDRHTLMEDTGAGTESQEASSSDRHRFRLTQQTQDGRQGGEQEVENSSLLPLLVKDPKGRCFSFFPYCDTCAFLAVQN